MKKRSSNSNNNLSCLYFYTSQTITLMWPWWSLKTEWLVVKAKRDHCEWQFLPRDVTAGFILNVSRNLRLPGPQSPSLGLRPASLAFQLLLPSGKFCHVTLQRRSSSNQICRQSQCSLLPQLGDDKMRLFTSSPLSLISTLSLKSIHCLFKPGSARWSWLIKVIHNYNSGDITLSPWPGSKAHISLHKLDGQ